MGQNQIVRKKNKGRPAKSDLRARGASPQDRRLRRSHRRRNVKYVFDLDDYFDDDGLLEVEDGEDQLRREKKVKLLLKVQSKRASGVDTPKSTDSQLSHTRRLQYQRSQSASSSSESDKPSKMRKIDEDMDEYMGDDNDDANDDDVYNNEDDDEVGEGNPESKAEVLTPGTKVGADPFGLPLADKKSLVLILDKLQKKDIYGVYAEPVDPEELPDYHDVIDNPMDFTTVRKKLKNGLYSTLDQFENDVFLICTNAMRYNAPDTIYHKQARSIQELAKKKFYKVKLNIQREEKEVKSELKARPNSILNERIQSSTDRMAQEFMPPNFSSRATLGAARSIERASSVLQAIGSEKPWNSDGLAEGSSLLNDDTIDRGEESLPGKSFLSRTGRKLSGLDDNRRSSYSISLTHPVANTESIFSTFEGESKLLVPVGVYSDHSYARSLARFSATLGPVAWGVASSRIEQALPQEIKFGRGWVGEFESLQTPILVLENCEVKETPFFAKIPPADDPKKFPKIAAISVSSKKTPSTVPFLDKKLPFLGPSETQPASAPTATSFPIKTQSVVEDVSEGKPSFFLAPEIKPGPSLNPIHKHQSSQSRSVVQSENKFLKPVELNGTSSFNRNVTDCCSPRQISRGSELEASRSMLTSRNMYSSPRGSVKQPDVDGAAVRGLPTGKVVANRNGSDILCSSPSELANGMGYYAQGQGQMVRMFAEKSQNQQIAEKSQNQQIPSNQSSVDATQGLSHGPNRDDLNNAAAAAARAWMSVGAGGFRPVAQSMNTFKNHIQVDSLYNSTHGMQAQVSRFREESPASGTGMHHQLDKNISSVGAYIPQGPIRPVNSDLHQNQPNLFQPFANAELSKFQLQPSWRNHSPKMPSRPRQESFPPDLNIGFQTTGSPGRPSSSVLVDSQQPDLALQL